MNIGIERFKSAKFFGREFEELYPEYKELLKQIDIVRERGTRDPKLAKEVYLQIANFVTKRGESSEIDKLGVDITETGFIEFVYKPGTPKSFEEYNKMHEDFDDMKERISANFTHIFNAQDLIENVPFVMDVEV